MSGSGGQGTSPDITDAMLALGQMGLDQGADAGRAQAFQWFRSAARGGDARAINMLGRCYEQGWGTDADPVRAADLYRKAADRGDAWAMFNLADLYYRGLGVAADDGAAYGLYAQAARRGHAKALNMLGMLHEDGRGVAADDGAARAYYQAAAEGGDCWGQFNHARMLIIAGDVAMALSWLRRSLETGFPAFFLAMADALAGHAHTHPELERLGAEARILARQGSSL